MGKDGYDRCCSLRKKMLKILRKDTGLFIKRWGRFYKKILNFSPKDGEDFLKSWPTFSKKMGKISSKAGRLLAKRYRRFPEKILYFFHPSGIRGKVSGEKHW